MTKPNITNVFVLMLENHSFDNIFAMSGIPGIRAATTKASNTYTPLSGLPPQTFHVQDGAPPSMTTDPGHEFPDVMLQLCGAATASAYKGSSYPAIDGSGFATSYATSVSEGTGTPSQDHIGDIMACFHTPSQLPVIHQLATEFALCDAWFSSLPGPTWPNRFFVHGASSSGMTQSPSLDDEVEWETYDGFKYANGSIYQHLSKAGHDWRLYQDKDNAFSDDPLGLEFGGWISQVAALKGVNLLEIHSLARFKDDLAKRAFDDTPHYLKYRYTFIEPNFGRSFFSPQSEALPGPTYKGGSSQHPEDNPTGGEGLIKFVYEAIRNSPIWDTSLLIVVYDEHGGFYDSVKPGPAVKPGDTQLKPENDPKYQFDFATYGVRVPAVIVSPLVAKGTVDPTIYDHASVLATLERLLGLLPLTERDKHANDVLHLLSNPVPRTDCPTALVAPANLPRRLVRPAGPAQDAPLPAATNTIGFSQILLKAELALCGGDEAARAQALARFKAIATKADAFDYLQSVRAKIGATRQ